MKRLTAFLLSLCAVLALAPAVHAQNINAQTGTTYTVLNTDCDPNARKLLTFNNASSVAVTLPQAGASGAFYTGCAITVLNIGLGTVTITPTTSTINGTSALTVSPFTGAVIYTDATPAGTGNYWAQTGASVGGGPSPQNFRNVIHNGGMAVQQRGTAERTCAANAGITSAAYVADRWGCQANVGSGAGFAKAVTTSLPTGFVGGLDLYRKTGALTQPVCVHQEIPTADFTPLAGQIVTLSFYAKADAGLSADNGNAINAYIITGTGTDEGLGTPTASPAITPAFTGVASTLTKAYTITTSWARYTYTTTIPSSATEGDVAFCFTPTASGSGTTDGFFLTGVQLENSELPTPFEFRPYPIEFGIAARYFYRINELAAGVVQSAVGTAQGTTTTCTTYFPFPVPMRTAATYANALSGSTFKIVSASQAATVLSTPFSATLTANGVTGASINFTTTGMTAKDSCFLVGAGGSGVIDFTADF